MSDRRYPDRPLVGVGAALFDAPLERVLLVQRAASPAKGRWSFPGGLVNVGETLEAACLREIEEETGLVATLCDVVTVVERVLKDERGKVEYHFVIVDFWGTVASGRLRAESDASAARWIELGAVSKLPTTRGIPEAVDRAVQLARGLPPSSPVLGR